VNFRILRGDICLASFRFPHEEEIQTKHRPVLIIQNDIDNESVNYPLVIIAPITTQKVERIYEQDVFIAKGEGSLEENSKVLLGAMQAVTKKALVRRLGSVYSETMERINLKLLRLLGFL